MTGTVVLAGAGRGFVVVANETRFVLTAAHCIPGEPPPPIPSRYSEESHYRDFLGTLSGQQNVGAKCLFVDPVADVAIFGEPAFEMPGEQWDAYAKLIGETEAFAIGQLQLGRTSDARMLSLDGNWFGCRVRSDAGRVLSVVDMEQPICGGMSGSPIILPESRAIGIVSEMEESGGISLLNPLLPDTLPLWFCAGVGGLV